MIFNMAGGMPLNFRIVGGVVQPANPKENTIWVNTSTDIAGWSFSAEVPSSPAEGMVWLKTAGSSPSCFNALKQNALMVYMASAEQYVSGVWVGKAAMIFIGGQWSELVEVIFGGSEDFSNWKTHTTKGAGGAVTPQGDGMLLHCNNTDSYGSHGVVQIHFMGFTDLSNYQTVRFTFGTVSGEVRRYAIGVTSSSESAYISPTDKGNWIAYSLVDTGGFYRPSELEPLECSIESVSTGHVSFYVMGRNLDLSISKIELF